VFLSMTLFSNGTKINCFNYNGRMSYWLHDKKNIPLCAMKQIVKHGGGSIMLWSCFACRGLGSLCSMQRLLNVRGYLPILEANLYLVLCGFDFNSNKSFPIRPQYEKAMFILMSHQKCSMSKLDMLCP